MSKKPFGLQCKSSLLIVLVLLQTYKHDYCGCNHVYTGLFKKIAGCDFMPLIIDLYNILTTRDCSWITVYRCRVPKMGIAQQRLGFVQVYILIYSEIYIWVMDNMR